MGTAHVIFALLELEIMLVIFCPYWWLGFKLCTGHVLCVIGSLDPLHLLVLSRALSIPG